MPSSSRGQSAQQVTDLRAADVPKVKHLWAYLWLGEPLALWQFKLLAYFFKQDNQGCISMSPVRCILCSFIRVLLILDMQHMQANAVNLLFMPCTYPGISCILMYVQFNWLVIMFSFITVCSVIVEQDRQLPVRSKRRLTMDGTIFVFQVFLLTTPGVDLWWRDVASHWLGSCFFSEVTWIHCRKVTYTVIRL